MNTVCVILDNSLSVFGVRKIHVMAAKRDELVLPVEPPDAQSSGAGEAGASFLTFEYKDDLGMWHRKVYWKEV